MNRDGLKRFVGGRVQLVPVAHRIDQNGRLLEPIDDDWLLESVTDQGASISNPRTGQFTTLGFDHIYEFTSNPDRSRGDARYSFLTLKVQIHLSDNSLWIRPTPRPGEPVPYVSPAPAVDLIAIGPRSSAPACFAKLKARNGRCTWKASSAATLMP